MGDAPAAAQGPVLRADCATLGEALAAAAIQHAEREAYVAGDQRITYATWIGRARRVAAQLVERGVGPGDVVAILLPSGIDYAICFAAISWTGAVATGLNTRLGAREVAAILERSRPALVIRDPRAFPEGDIPVAELLRGDLAVGITLGGRPAPVRPEDPAVIVWTSGTTGTPKGAWYDHRNLAAAARTAGVMSAPYDRKLVATPFAHAGYMGKLWDQLAWGTTVVVSPVPWSADEMARILRDERITVAGGVPTQWAKLLELSRTPQEGRLPHLRVGIAATAPASPELVRRTAELIGVPLVVRYAMTESPSICGTDPDDPPEVQANTVGHPQDGMQIQVVDEDVKPVSDGTIGLIRIRGPVVMRGYWRDPEQTAAAIDEAGWLRSGDLGFITARGDLTLVGRTGDMYIRGGYNVYPLEVENVLLEHPLVAKAAVLGLPAPVIGEIGVAAVVPTDPARPPTLDDLRQWSRERLADYKAPDRLELVDDLPLTAMLKIDRKALLERLIG
ncbi:MAG: putative acyl-CoA synthetase [Mycobacterium sp.]|nr:putative acyl-CoA synthetase [Mycobacterium sp.]